MPHIVIEHSDTLAPIVPDVLRQVCRTVVDSALFDPQAVKGRALAYSAELLPEQGRNFMHITLSILEGRTQVERAALSLQVFDAAKQSAPEIDRLSVDIREMVKATYTK
jgi:5-carboxymethyl-2-hydroxymuconate isomerase